MKAVYNPTAAEEILSVARTYYDHRERLIYAFKGMTFLQGSPLHDAQHDFRGNIDCSTYVQLVLQGIPYEESPYVTGETAFVPNRKRSWIQDKLYRNLRRDANLRRANEIARAYYEDGYCFEDPSEVKPGDLIFYRAPEEVISFYRERGCFMEICHVAIAINDSIMFHSTGLPDKDAQEEENMPAIQITPLTQDRIPILFARPDYGP